MAPGKKRARAEDGDDARASEKPSGASVGQQTSYIKNKLIRSEKYAKLKHKQKVRAPDVLRRQRQLLQPVSAAACSTCM